MAGPAAAITGTWLDQYALPLVSESPAGHACDEPPMGGFKVRCKHYVTKGHPRKGKKEPSSPAAFKLLRVFLVPAKAKIDHIVDGALGKSSQFRFAAVFQVNVKDFVQHIIFLFERNVVNDANEAAAADLPAFTALYNQCIAPGTQLMADRLKILPFLTNASFVMTKVVNNQPGQLAEALECKQFDGEGYVEVDVDIDAYKSSSVFTKLAKAAVGLVYPQVANLTIDLAFMMAALTEDELPERLIGAARLHKIQLNRKERMLGTTTPTSDFSVSTHPSFSQAIQDMRKSLGDTSHAVADWLEGDEDGGGAGSSSGAGPSGVGGAGSSAGAGGDEDEVSSQTSSAGGARYKKKGVARQFQRFGHWMTNDHPEYTPSPEPPPGRKGSSRRPGSVTSSGSKGRGVSVDAAAGGGAVALGGASGAAPKQGSPALASLRSSPKPAAATQPFPAAAAAAAPAPGLADWMTRYCACFQKCMPAPAAEKTYVAVD